MLAWYLWCAGARRERNNNKHKRLFIGGPGALQDGQRLFYRTGQDGALLRQGIAVINPDGVSGIKCDCCNNVSREAGRTQGAEMSWVSWPHASLCTSGVVGFVPVTTSTCCFMVSSCTTSTALGVGIRSN